MTKHRDRLLVLHWDGVFRKTMNKKRAIRKRAEELAEEGLGRQHIYDQILLEGTTLKEEKVAEIVRWVPSLAAREAYKVPHALLLVVLWAVAVLKSWAGLSLAAEKGWGALIFMILLPSATVYMAVMIAKYRGQYYRWAAFLAIYGLLRNFGMILKELDPLSVLDILPAVIIAVLGLYLHNKAVPEAEEKLETYLNDQGQKRGRKVYVFPPEPVPAHD